MALNHSDVTYIIFLWSLSEQANNYHHNARQPEQHHSEVHVMNLGNNCWSCIWCLTLGLRKAEVCDHTRNTNYHSRHQTPEGSLHKTQNIHCKKVAH